nr:MAG TPA_asm: IrrE protein [Caudoviricetes sp.]
MKGKFNNNRLKKALEYRRINITSLSKQTCISRQTLTEYRNNPSATVDLEKIKTISEVLNFPFQFFYENDLILEKDAIYFRSQLTTKQYYRKAQQVKLELIAGIYNFLKEYIDFPLLDVPECSNLTPEEAAQKVREEWGLGNKPIENIIPLLEQHGIVVVCLDTDTDAIDAFSQKFILDNKQEAYIFGYSANKKSAARIHFDMAHELGHICLHDWRFNDELDSEEFKEKEKEAHRFASAFLLPEREFMYDLKKHNFSIKAYTEMKKKWKASILAMLVRAWRLGVINNIQYKNMIIKMQKLGIRKQEPLDSELVTAEPCILKTAINLLLINKIFTKHEFMSCLSEEGNVTLYAEQVEQLLGLTRGTLQESKLLTFSNVRLKTQ